MLDPFYAIGSGANSQLFRRGERMMEGMIERMSNVIESLPEDSPPKVVVSGIRHMQEQNALLSERLPVEKASPRGRPQAKETGEPSSD